MKSIYCRKAPSLGALEESEEKIWGTPEYEGELDSPTIFFGLYGLPDFYTLWRHRGPRYILWAGSDITHFLNGFWLEEGGRMKIEPEQLAPWINKYCFSWVENEVERLALAQVGIEAKVQQSFLGDVTKYPVLYTQNDRPKVYLSVSGENFKEYGWDIIEEIADECNVDFYLYGSSWWKSEKSNIFVRGRVPKDVMNAEISQMQCGLRLNEFDGFSEITAKSILWGQYPIVLNTFKYPLISGVANKQQLIWNLNALAGYKTPCIAGREYYLNNLNKFPWV